MIISHYTFNLIFLKLHDLEHLCISIVSFVKCWFKSFIHLFSTRLFYGNASFILGESLVDSETILKVKRREQMINKLGQVL